MAIMYFRPLLLLLLLLLSSSSSLHQGESTGDRDALLAFKEGLSDHSGSLSSWNSTNADLCRWAGVACSQQHPGRVLSLYLSSRGLAGTISPVIGNLTFLRTLQLDSNMLSGEIPRTIGQLPRLRHLNISNNSVRGEIPEELCNCSNLVTMTLGKNQLQGEIPTALGSLSRSVDSGGDDFRALVFEFMPNFSLDRWLHPRTDDQCHKLSTVHMLNIAVDVADALDYLHNNSQPSVIHCDVKPSNILLDNDWTAYVADFGVSKLVGESTDQSRRMSSGSSIGIRGTTGYVAPEYGLGGQVSAAGDAYSFGITLLEMFTGRAPTDYMFREGLSLHLFAEMAYADKISEIINPILLQMQPYSNDANAMACLASVVRIGILCSNETASQRMNMKNVAAELI